MKTYLVGGAVRDKLLGKVPKDLDYIVINSNHEEMVRNKFIPVGKSHSVYLHPITRAEYTLAKDLYSDLERRDITINAMAMDNDDVIDPFGGVADLRTRTLKHVKEENFFTDPLRVYRVARFKSQLEGFHISSETFHLMKNVAELKTFERLAPERILNELTKALTAALPEEFFLTLKESNALRIHFPELFSLPERAWKHTLNLLHFSTIEQDGMTSYASLFIEMEGLAAKELSRRLLVSNEWERAAVATLLFYRELTNLKSKGSAFLIDLFYRMDAFRKEYLISVMATLLELDGFREESSLMKKAFILSKEVSARDVKFPATGKLLGEQIRSLRIKRLESFSLR